MGSTPLAGLPYPDLTDPPNGPSQFLAALAATEKQVVLDFTTEAARNAAIVSPVAGMLAFLTTPRQLTMYDGTGWIIMDEPAQAYTPVFAGVTVGNGVRTGSYYRVGGRCYFTTRFVLGTTSAVAGPVTVETPTLRGDIPAGTITGAAWDASLLLSYSLLGIREVSHVSDKAVRLFPVATSGSYAGIAGWGASIPFGAAWATGDELEVSGWYPMRTRYL